MVNMQEMMKKAEKVFDTIDFEPYLRLCKTLDEFRDALERAYDNTPITNNDFMEGCIWNVHNDYEIVDYLKKRYGNKVSFYEYPCFAVYWEG